MLFIVNDCDKYLNASLLIYFSNKRNRYRESPLRVSVINFEQEEEVSKEILSLISRIL